jgi:hypothetical protein
MLTVNDDCYRENLCVTAGTSISGARVARELDALVRVYGKLACIVTPSRACFADLAEQRSDRIHRWETSPLQKHVEPWRNLKAPRTTHLPKTKPPIKKSKPASSQYE